MDQAHPSSTPYLVEKRHATSFFWREKGRCANWWIAFLFLVAILAVGMREAQTDPGFYVTSMVWNQTEIAGLVTAWNSPLKLVVQVEPVDFRQIYEVQAGAGLTFGYAHPTYKNIFKTVQWEN